MSDTWKEKLYEPSDELIAVQNVNYQGAESCAEGEELILSLIHI